MLSLAAYAFVSLGRWQLRRADEHRQIRLSFTRSTDLPELSTLPSARDVQQVRYRRIRLNGRYVVGRNVLMDNMTYDNQAGYEVLTPFVPSDGSAWLMVNRGWVPANPDRRVLPQVGFGSTAPQMVVGRVAPFPAPAIRLGDSAATEAAPGLLRASYPTAEGLGRALGHAVYPYQLLLDAKQPLGFTRDWRPNVMSPQRNLAYAGQWFLFALIALVAAAAIVIKRARSAGKAGEADAR